MTFLLSPRARYPTVMASYSRRANRPKRLRPPAVMKRRDGGIGFSAGDARSDRWTRTGGDTSRLMRSATHPKAGLPIATHWLCLRSRRWVFRHGRWSPYTGPFTGLGWRVALDSWYAAVLELEDCRDRSRRPLGGGADAPPEVKRFSASLARSPLVAQQNARLAEGRRRWRDWTGCWYHAGLAAGGVGVDWRGWYRGRIATWTGGDSALEGPSAAGELAKLDSRLDHFETLPAYWLS